MLKQIIYIPGLNVVLTVMGIVSAVLIISFIPYYFLIIKHVDDEAKAEMEAYELEAFHNVPENDVI